MSFYAIVLDEELAHSDVLRLIASGPTQKSIKGISTFNPYTSYSKLMKENFNIDRISNLSLKSQFSGQLIDAYTCKITAR